MAAYRRGGAAIQDWSDLLQPRLQGRLGFSDTPREFVGVALKTLGLPFNCSHTQLKASGVTTQQLADRLYQLRQQVGVCWALLPLPHVPLAEFLGQWDPGSAGQGQQNRFLYSGQGLQGK